MQLGCQDMQAMHRSVICSVPRSWADSWVIRLQAMIADYSPLGSASCALFARKFREEDVLTYLSVAEGFLQRPPALEPIR